MVVGNRLVLITANGRPIAAILTSRGVFDGYAVKLALLSPLAQRNPRLPLDQRPSEKLLRDTDRR